MSFLYIGTFGSFIGYAAAFPLLIKGQFPDVNVTTYAFLGALVGSLVRPLGGRLADRVGGARVTAASFVAMGARRAAAWSGRSSLQSFAAVLRRVHAAVRRDRGRQRVDVPDDPGDLPPRGRRTDPAAVTGAPPGAPPRSASSPRSAPTAASWCRAPTAGRRRASASIVPALYVYVGLYAVMLAVTWAFYLRRGVGDGQGGV